VCHEICEDQTGSSNEELKQTIRELNNSSLLQEMKVKLSPSSLEAKGIRFENPVITAGGKDQEKCDLAGISSGKVKLAQSFKANHEEWIFIYEN